VTPEPSDKLEGAFTAAALAQALPHRPHPELRGVAEGLAAATAGELQAIIFFGSRLTGAGANQWSAFDAFAIVGRYRRFYGALRRAGLVRRPAWLLAMVSWPLPPTQLSLRSIGEGGKAVHVKAAVLSSRAFARETSRSAIDHFCLGRLFQPAQVVWAASDGVGQTVARGLVDARRETYRWIRPWLPEAFDAETYCRTLLRVSLHYEVRPEPQGRADRLQEAQGALQLPLFSLLLRELETRGELVALEGRPGWYRLRRSAGWPERTRLRLYFLCSLVRATSRWLKHIVSFEGWLEYVVKKAERHTGQLIPLSESERRQPILLIPRFLRYFRQKNRIERTP
jgi:hypothetical protein